MYTFLFPYLYNFNEKKFGINLLVDYFTYTHFFFYIKEEKINKKKIILYDQFIIY